MQWLRRAAPRTRDNALLHSHNPYSAKIPQAIVDRAKDNLAAAGFMAVVAYVEEKFVKPGHVLPHVMVHGGHKVAVSMDAHIAWRAKGLDPATRPRPRPTLEVAENVLADHSPWGLVEVEMNFAGLEGIGVLEIGQ